MYIYTLIHNLFTYRLTCKQSLGNILIFMSLPFKFTHTRNTYPHSSRQTDKQTYRQTSKKHWQSTLEYATFFGQKQHFSYTGTFFLPGQTSESEEICSHNFCAFEFLMTSPSKVSHAGPMSCNASVRNTRSMRAQVRSQSENSRFDCVAPLPPAVFFCSCFSMCLFWVLVEVRIMIQKQGFRITVVRPEKTAKKMCHWQEAQAEVAAAAAAKQEERAKVSSLLSRLWRCCSCQAPGTAHRHSMHFKS